MFIPHTLPAGICFLFDLVYGGFMTVRIDSLEPDTRVDIQVGNAPVETAYFLCLEGEGDDRWAKFASESDGEWFVWSAHRRGSRWVVGAHEVGLKLIGVGTAELVKQ